VQDRRLVVFLLPRLLQPVVKSPIRKTSIKRVRKGWFIGQKLRNLPDNALLSHEDGNGPAACLPMSLNDNGTQGLRL